MLTQRAQGPSKHNILLGPKLPKGPFRTKTTTAIAKIVNYYAVVFLLRPPNLLRQGPLLERENVCNFQGNGVHTRRAAIVNHPAVLKILRVVNLLRVVFLVRRGPLGIADPEKCFQELTSEKLLILLQEWPCVELIIVSSNFQALLLLQEKLREAVWKQLIPARSS